jgi:hypothetical protein
VTATEPARAPSRPADWPDFVAELARTLAALGPTESLVLEVVPEGSAAPPSYYVQFAPQPGGLRAEAVGNAFLPEPAQLNDAELERLEQQGWTAPASQAPNFWKDWSAPVPNEEVADLAVTTLRLIYGAQTPADIREQRRAGRTPGPASMPAAHGAPVATIESVRRGVDQAMHDLFGVEDLKKDEHDELWPFEFGSAAVHVRVYGEPPIVQVMAPLLTELHETPELIEAVNGLNLNVAFAKIVWTGDAIVASIEMFGAPFTPLHLSHACSVIGAIADDHVHVLQQRFGGRMGNGAFRPPPRPSRVGGYL